MAPKKRGQQPPSASQPLPDSKSTRSSGRKRRHSDASNVSEQPADDSKSTGAPKRRKRGRQTAAGAEPEVIVEEEEQQHEVEDLDVHHTSTHFGGDATVENEPPESIEVLQMKHVHFGQGAIVEESATATNLTPHPRKMAIKHRVSNSPLPSSFNRGRTTISRASLPPAFSQSQEENGLTSSQLIQEFQFKPLRDVLDERVRRRLRRSGLSEVQNEVEEHSRRESRTEAELDKLKEEALEKEERIQNLNFELEAQRQAAIDLSEDADQDKVRDLEVELEELKRELHQHMTTHRLEEHIQVVPDDEMMVLDHMQTDVQYPQLPRTSSLRASQRTLANLERFSDDKDDLPDIVETSGRPSASQAATLWNGERHEFQNAILALSGEAERAKRELQILHIELNGLGFGFGDGTEDGYLAILESIRDSHNSIRDFMDDALPGTLPDDATTKDIVEIVIANCREFMLRLQALEEDGSNKDLLIAKLGNQVNGLVDHLAENKVRNETLEQRWQELDQEHDDDIRRAEELEEELAAQRADKVQLQEELNIKNEEVMTLGADHAESIKNIEKLALSLENYRKEETRLTELIERMELGHSDTIAKMNQEREETVQDLEMKLDAENVMRSDAERINGERQTDITRLELLVEEISTERDNLREELEVVRIERDTEVQTHQAAETELEEKDVLIEDLETRVDKLEKELTELNATVDQYRMVNETERRQREAAEQDLDDRNLEIEGLKEKLQKSGKDANELRLKLHEVQQQNTERIAELQTEASERDEQYQTDIADEVARREQADELAQERAATILELQTELEAIQLQMRNDLATRDERIAELETEAAEKDQEIENLRLDLRSAENELDVERTNFADRKDDLDITIQALRDTIDDHLASIAHLQEQELLLIKSHNAETDARDLQIADLHAQIENLTALRDELEHDKAGLERRVEEEAEAMLQTQNENEDRIEDLKRQLLEKQQNVLVVEKKAREADRQWEVVMQQKDEELELLRQSQMGQEEVITTTKTRYVALMDQFKDFVKRSNGTIAALRDQAAVAARFAEQDGAVALQDGESMLAELDAMDVEALVRETVTTSKTVKTVASQSSAGAGGKKGKGKKSKRVQDSGIGLDVDGEDEAMLA